MSLQLCHPYVWEDPRYMFKSWATDAKCVSELVNRVVVTYLVFIVTGVLIASLTHVSILPLVSGILATAILIPTFVSLGKIQSGQDISGSEAEGFLNENNPTKECSSASASQTKEGMRNPFNNVLVDEYANSPTRERAADITTTESKVALDAMFRTQWYSDPTDVFGKTQSQRIFITNPVTTIPNDQGSYQDWLYKIPGKTCKEGNPEACYGGTEGAVMPWLNL
jgi:hypothetical protein